MNIESLAGSALVIFIIKEVWESIKGANKKNTEAIQQLTLSITELKVRIDMLIKLAEDIPEIKRDLDHAHKKIRDLGEKLS